jgi:hypothetical protein
MEMEGPEAARNAFRCLSTMPLVGLLAPSFAVTMPCADATPEPFEDFSNRADEKFETASYASTWDPMEDDLDESRSSSSACCTEQPSDDLDVGIVKNTFIHFAAAPMAHVRSSSVPRCMRLGRSR